MQDDLDARCSQLTECQRHAEDLQSRLNEVLVREAELERQNEAVEREIAKYQELNQQLEKSCSSLQEDVTDKYNEIARLEESLQEAEEVLAQKEAQLGSIQVNWLTAKVYRFLFKNQETLASNYWI